MILLLVRNAPFLLLYARTMHILLETLLENLFKPQKNTHSNLRASLDDLLRRLVGVLLEILIEQLAELGDLVLEVGGAGPALLGVEQLVGDVAAGFGDLLEVIRI
jgi:hypothetical protein